MFLNKHFYIVLIITTISKYTNNKVYKYIIWVIKILVLVNIIFGITYILYFTISFHSFTLGFSVYQDLITFYLDKFINLWTDLIYMDVEDKISDFTNKINEINNKYKIMGNIQEDLGLQMKQDISVQIKDGVKEALNEVVDEALDKMHADDRMNFYKNIVGGVGILLLGYFIFILPGSTISPEDLIQYNWFNQSLIEIKLNIINLFSNPKGPGNPGGPEVISPSTSIGQATITPNSPITSSSSLSPYFKNVVVDSSTQTIIGGKMVSKMVETTNVLADALGKEEAATILNHVNSVVKTITD